jgi:hypothetical protein
MTKPSTRGVRHVPVLLRQDLRLRLKCAAALRRVKMRDELDRIVEEATATVRANLERRLRQRND